MTHTRKTRWAAPLLALFLSGCQLMPVTTFHPPPLTDEQLTAWLEAGEYQQALQALLNAPEVTDDDPRLQRVRQAIAQQQQQVTAEIRLLLAQNQWHPARQLLAQSQQQLPDSPQLQAAEQAIETQRQRQRLQAQAEEAILRAPWLQSRLELQQHLLLENNTYFGRLRMQQLQRERDQLIDSLIQLAEQALQHEQTELARRCLTSAYKLLPPDQSSPRLAQLEQQLENGSQRYQQRQRQQEAQLRKQIAQALSRKDYLQARQLGEQLRQLPDLHTASRDQLLRLQQRLAERTQQLDQAGDAQYVQGNVEQAAKQWSKALQLQPDNRPIQDKLLRAQRVLENLRQLRQ